MRKAFLVATVAIASVAAILGQAAPRDAQQAGTEQAVKLVRDWLDAEAHADTAALNRMFAEDFIGSSFGGNIVSKADIVPQYESGPRIPPSTVKEATARVFGETIVVMGRVAANDPQQPGEFRFTFVEMKREGRWQVVAAHLSR